MSAARQARSARYRLAAVNLVVLALVLAVTLGAAAFSASGSSQSLVDQELREVAERVVGRVSHDENEAREHRGGKGSHEDDDDEEEAGSRERAPDPFASAEIGDEPGVIVVLASAGQSARRPDGRAMPAGLPDNAALAAAFGGNEVLTDRVVGGTPMRLLSAPIRQSGRVVGVVQLAKPTAEARASLTRTFVILAATGLAGLVLSAVGSLFLAARAMRPIELSMERQRRFIADASHELRTPVAVLRARAELLSRDPSALPADVRGELSQLHRDAEELSGLLGELLDLARLDSGVTRLEVGPVPIGDVAEEVVQQLEPLARERGVSLSAQVQPVFALASSTHLRQVLRALLDNALAHTSAGGNVRVEVEAEGPEHARLAVSDDGEGIRPEHLPNVKERFYRADSARGRAPGQRRGGAGLGLSIANELVQAMGGELRVESELGRGTTMTVVLPLAKSLDAEA